ncbi:carbohydrate ABC transporter permease [Paenibacillus sedimenti]|uniref:Sugar ABC transporter permease n=1 Tax=Paenibacillus sedimenti TaxID=2770274 RepID=A0A926KND5_9BACL|nr:sugar ABC transporter permease [Paenibacillus sedimenti]MBD0379956.1 sugar ABC transporter permease [Paenibacillus sedimenti]
MLQQVRPKRSAIFRRLSGPDRDGPAALLFLAPSLIGFALFYLIPFIGGIYYSLMDSPVDGTFVGTDNYREVWNSESFRKAAVNTAYFAGIGVPLLLVVSLAIAVLLNRSLPLRRWFRTAFVLPLVVPVASVVLFWQVLFDTHGWLNSLLTESGYAPVNWMESSEARAVIILMYVWKNAGYNIVLLLAGLQTIPRDYYETASIDGAGKFRQFFGITLRYLIPTLFFVTIMSVVGSFKVFRETYLMAGEYPHDSIYMLQHYMNNMFLSLDYQKLTSAAYIMAVGIIALVVLLFQADRRFRHSIE